MDLASGAGDPALTLAAAVGSGGCVTATDLVPDMLGAAADAARRRGLANVACQVADAEALPFAIGAADRVTCRFGVCFFPDPPAALRAAGFTRVVPWPWPGPPEQCRAQALDAVGVRQLHARLPPEHRDRALAAALAAIRGRYDGRRVRFEATIVVAWAER